MSSALLNLGSTWGRSVAEFHSKKGVVESGWPLAHVNASCAFFSIKFVNLLTKLSIRFHFVYFDLRAFHVNIYLLVIKRTGERFIPIFFFCFFYSSFFSFGLSFYQYLDQTRKEIYIVCVQTQRKYTDRKFETRSKLKLFN